MDSRFVLFLGIAAGFSAPAAPRAAEVEKRLADWATANAAPIAVRSFDADSSDLEPLRRIVGDAKIVALGEPAHGAQEPLALRNRIFRHLVEHHGFTAIAVETAFAESRRIHEFVRGGEGDAASIVRRHMSYGFGRFAENVALVQWLHDFNRQNPDRRKVNFYGIDVGLKPPQFAVPTPTALADALSFLERVDPVAAGPVKSVLQPALERLRSNKNEAGFPSDAELVAVDELGSILERQRPGYIEAHGRADFEWAAHSAAMAREEFRYARLNPGGDGSGIPPGAWRSMNTRDAAMAASVRWILSREGSAGRILVFAHNAHVMAADVRGGLWSALERPAVPMGRHLRSGFGASLVILGVAAGANGEGFPAPSSTSGSFDSILARVGRSAFLLPLRANNPEASVAEWLRQPRPWRANYASEMLVAPGVAFDACVFVERLTPARMVGGGAR
jgi:erythromycin esterase